MKEKRQMRYSDIEMQLIKSIFAENDALAKVLRKAFLEDPMSKEEQEMIRATFARKEVAAVIKKTLAPVLDPDAPMFQQADLYIGTKLDFVSPEKVSADISVRQIFADYMYYMCDVLTEPRCLKVEMGVSHLQPKRYNPEATVEERVDVAIRLQARDTIISHINFQLSQLLILAGKKDETAEETKRRLQKDSAR